MNIVLRSIAHWLAPLGQVLRSRHERKIDKVNFSTVVEVESELGEKGNEVRMYDAKVLIDEGVTHAFTYHGSIRADEAHGVVYRPTMDFSPLYKIVGRIRLSSKVVHHIIVSVPDAGGDDRHFLRVQFSRSVLI